MKKRDPEWCAKVLRECHERKLTPPECAAHIGVSLNMVYLIFRRKQWKKIPRPRGFRIPRNRPPIEQVKTQRRRQAFFARYVAERMTPLEFAAMIGLSMPYTYAILRGEEWKNTERPPGFMYPWPERNFGRPRHPVTEGSKDAAE